MFIKGLHCKYHAQIDCMDYFGRYEPKIIHRNTFDRPLSMSRNCLLPLVYFGIVD
jgi:hypothetical protein